jgi:hypothetical protein
MLGLKQSLSLSSNRALGGWTPASEGTDLVAWYKNKEGITVDVGVSAWADSSSFNHDMVQDTDSKQPAYNASTGALTFDKTASQSLQTTSQISISDDFTVGVRLEPSAINVIVLGDNTINNEFFKIKDSTTLRFKLSHEGTNTHIDITVNDGNLTDDNYLVVTRDSNLVSLYVNGTLQTDTETLAGIVDIDAIGVRSPDANPYDGIIKEVQIYDSTSAALTANVNDYLSNL